MPVLSGCATGPDLLGALQKRLADIHRHHDALGAENCRRRGYQLSVGSRGVLMNHLFDPDGEYPPYLLHGT